MSTGTHSVGSVKRKATAEYQTTGLPATSDLTSAYVLSLGVALIMMLASVLGLLFQEVVYQTDELLLSFVPSDIFNLAFGLPILLGSLWLARRGALIGLLCWPGALFYVLYMYVPYMISVPFSILTLLYLSLVAISAYTMIHIIANIDRESVSQRLRGFVPARISAVLLVSLGLLIVVRQTAVILSVLTNQTPLDILELSAWVADFMVAIPALLIVGIQLWRHRGLGYITGAGMLLGYGMLALSLVPFFLWQARLNNSQTDVAGMITMLVMAALCFVHLAFFARGAALNDTSFQNLNATRVIATTIGVFFGVFSGVNHGIFEILQGNNPTNGLLIHAIGEAQRFWPLGTEDAFTIIPNFMLTGIVSMIVGLTIVIWSIWFLPSKHGPAVFLGLFILSFLVGGGIGQVAFFVPAWAFATRIDKPLTWWRKVLPRNIWPFLSRLWAVLLVVATIVMTIGLEMAIFGYFPGLTNPVAIQDSALFLVLSAAILYVLSFIAGFGHELRRIE
jgi:hypothetical protein